MHFNSEMGQPFELGKMLMVKLGAAFRIAGHKGNYCSEMPWAEPPNMQVHQLVTGLVDHRPDLAFNPSVCTGIHQDCTGLAYQAVGPVGDHEGTDNTCQRVHPQPAKCLGQQQANNSHNGHGRVRNNVNASSSHIMVAAVHAMVVMSMLREFDDLFAGWHGDGYLESMRLRNVAGRFQKAGFLLKVKDLSRTVLAYRRDGDIA